MRSRWFALLLVTLIVPLSGSTCVIKSGSHSHEGGGTKIVVCNPPSPACSPNQNDPGNTIIVAPTLRSSPPSVDENRDTQDQLNTRTFQASSSIIASQQPQSSFLPAPGRMVSSIPEPGAALVFFIGTLMIARHLSARDGC